MNLKLIPFFSDFDDPLLSLLERHANIANYQKNEIIHFEDDTCTYLEVILSGSIIISHSTSDGSIYTIKVLSTNSFISPNNLFASDPKYIVYIEARETTKILRIPKEIITDALEFTSFRESFIRLLSDTGRTMGSRLMFEKQMNLRTKIQTYLNHQRMVTKSNIISLPVSKTLLANSFGVARTSLSRELQKMVNEGIIQVNNKEIKLLS